MGSLNKTFVNVITMIATILLLSEPVDLASSSSFSSYDTNPAGVSEDSIPVETTKQVESFGFSSSADWSSYSTNSESISDSPDSIPAVIPSLKPDGSSESSLSSSRGNPEVIPDSPDPIQAVSPSSSEPDMSSESSMSSSSANPEVIPDSPNPIPEVPSSSKPGMSSESLMSSSSADFPDSTTNSNPSSNPSVETFSPRVRWLTAGSPTLGSHDGILDPLESSSAPESSSPIIDYSYGKLPSSSQDTDIYQVSHSPLMHGFFGGYIAGVSSIIILVMVVALVSYIVRPRRRHARHDTASPDVKCVSALPLGVYQGYSGRESVAAKRAAKEVENWAGMGAVGAKVGEGDGYQEIIINHDKCNAIIKQQSLSSPDNDYETIIHQTTSTFF